MSAESDRLQALRAAVSQMAPIAYRYGLSDEEPELAPRRVQAVGVALPDTPEWREVSVAVPRDTEPVSTRLEGRPLLREAGLRLMGKLFDRLRRPTEVWASPGRYLTREGPDEEWEDMSRPLARKPGEARHENDNLWPLDLLTAPAAAIDDMRETAGLIELDLDLKPLQHVLSGIRADDAKRHLSAIGHYGSSWTTQAVRRRSPCRTPP